MKVTTPQARVIIPLGQLRRSNHESRRIEELKAVISVLIQVIDQKGHNMQPQSDTAQEVGNELLSDAKDVGTSAVNRLHSEVDARKSDAANQVKSVSSAIGQAAGGLDPNAPAWLKSAFEQGAQQVQKFAETLEQKDSRELVSSVSDFARGSPATFLGACAAAGFAAARIFKAGGSENTPAQLGPVGTDHAISGNYQATGNYQPTGDAQTGSSTPAAFSTGSPRADFAS